MTPTENYQEILPVGMQGLPGLLDHMREVTRRQLFEGDEWPMSEERESDFIDEMGINQLLVDWAGDPDPGTLFWLGHYVMYFAGVDTAGTVAAHLKSFCASEEFEAAQKMTDGPEQTALVRSIAQREFEAFWQRVDPETSSIVSANTTRHRSLRNFRRNRY